METNTASQVEWTNQGIIIKAQPMYWYMNKCNLTIESVLDLNGIMRRKVEAISIYHKERLELLNAQKHLEDLQKERGISSNKKTKSTKNDNKAISNDTETNEPENKYYLRREKVGLARKFLDYLRTLKVGTKAHCRIPDPILKMNEFWNLPRAAHKLLILLYKYRNNISSISSPGLKELNKKYGVSKKQWEKGIHSLKIHGFALHVGLSGHKRASEYFIPANPMHVKEIKEFNETHYKHLTHPTGGE